MTKLNGEYSLQGIHDMAAGFRFTPDGKFEFFYIYGASDRNATGTYTIEGDTVKLKSDKEPGKDFKIDSQSKKGKGYTIKVTPPNEYLLRNILCFYFDGEAPNATPTNSAETDSKGIIHLDITSVDSIYLRHEIFPDIPTLIKDKDNANNYFELLTYKIISSKSKLLQEIVLDVMLNTMTIELSPNLAIVDSSVPVIWNAPSPTRMRERWSGRAICAPSAAGMAKPILV